MEVCPGESVRFLLLEDLDHGKALPRERGTDAISWYVHGDHSANVSYKYEEVLKVVRRSRATLIFSVGVPMVKPHGSQRTGFLLLGRPSVEA